MAESEDARESLVSIAASLRAYLEWQRDTGAVGIPRRPRSAGASVTPPPPDVQTTAREAPPPPTEERPRRAPAPPPEAAVTPPPMPDFDALGAAEPVARVPTVSAKATVAAKSEPVDPATRGTRLPILATEVKACTKCGLAATRTNTVFARGNPDAALCFVGEAPGADEDAEGLPFVGRAGQLLDKMIGAMGLDADKDVYVCNIVKCRPPENRKPTPEEMETCLPYLHEQLALVRPKVIVTLGNTAAAGLLGTKLGITKLRGQWKLYKGATLVMPTYHPSYLLRPSAQQAEAKRQAWDDLQLVMKELGLEAKKGKA